MTRQTSVTSPGHPKEIRSSFDLKYCVPEAGYHERSWTWFSAGPGECERDQPGRRQSAEVKLKLPPAQAVL
ncbi:hypothetical protein AOLI_G00071110 [Acnodon oligacanthus]